MPSTDFRGCIRESASGIPFISQIEKEIGLDTMVSRKNLSKMTGIGVRKMTGHTRRERLAGGRSLESQICRVFWARLPFLGSRRKRN